MSTRTLSVYHVLHGDYNPTTLCKLEFIHFMFYNHVHVGKSSKLKPEHFVVIYRKEFRLHFSTFLEWTFSTLVKVDMAKNYHLQMGKRKQGVKH